jgi:predicted GNAT family acetyltransferase
LRGGKTEGRRPAGRDGRSVGVSFESGGVRWGPVVNAGSVADDPGRHRFVLEADGDEAELVYRRNGRRLVLIHTGVPDALSGRGIGGRLVAAAVRRAREDGLTLVPLCPYARRWLERHPDEAADVAVDWARPEPRDDPQRPE